MGERTRLLRRWKTFTSDDPADKLNLNMFQTYLNVYWIHDAAFLRRVTGTVDDVRELQFESMQGWWNRKGVELEMDGKGLGLSPADMTVDKEKFNEKMLIKTIDLLFNYGKPWHLADFEGKA